MPLLGTTPSAISSGRKHSTARTNITAAMANTVRKYRLNGRIASSSVSFSLFSQV